MDLATAQQHLEAWLAAELALASAQEYTFQTPNGLRQVKRAELADVREQIKFWTTQVNTLSTVGRKKSRFSFAAFNHNDR